MKSSSFYDARRPDLQHSDVWEEIVAVGGDRVTDPSPISTIRGEVASYAGESSPTKFAGDVWEEIAAVGGDRVADLNRHRSPPSKVRSRAALG
ncbi:hypothetical protein TIFTF001_023595 [Ficus carica]|uniref:Uncharacterized protein n=1 Tax=Ficus carica TaxID=3494 RepID=A0AA88AM09_FICCA|nr:hypothetical protein TIFTF001_023595 [Ficus carica]